MTFDEIVAKVSEKFADAIVETKADAVDPYLVVSPDKMHDVARFLHDTEGLAFDNLPNLTATDYPPEKIQLTYHLWSYPHHHMLVLKTDVPRDNPSVATVSDIWQAANWHEREMYDLVGVEFENHPDLRRILLPEDWDGHPLRKDWEEKPTYHDMSTSRQFSNKLFKKMDVETRKVEPLKALLVYDDSGKGAEQMGQFLAIRLRVADIETEMVAVSKANPSTLMEYDLLIFGANTSGLLFSGPSPTMSAFIDLLPKLQKKPCVLYVAYLSNPGAAIRDLDAKVIRKGGKIIARGAAHRRHPGKDPDDLATSIVKLVRQGAFERRPFEDPYAEEAAEALAKAAAAKKAKEEAAAAKKKEEAEGAASS